MFKIGKGGYLYQTEIEGGRRKSSWVEKGYDNERAYKSGWDICCRRKSRTENNQS